jgi:hypothetical protein
MIKKEYPYFITYRAYSNDNKVFDGNINLTVDSKFVYPEIIEAWAERIKTENKDLNLNKVIIQNFIRINLSDGNIKITNHFEETKE